MRIKIILMFFFLLFLISCENNTEIKKQKTTSFVINKNDTLTHKIIKTRLFPEKYTEKTEDTLVANSTLLSIKQFTTDNDFIIQENDFGEDTIYQDKYRDNKVSIKVTKNDILVSDILFDKYFFIETTDSSFMKIAIIQSSWFISYNKATEEIKIGLLLCKPETDYCYVYSLYVNMKNEIRYEMEEVI